MCRRAVGNREGTQKEKDKAQCVRSRGATHRIGVCRAGGRPRSTASGSAVSASDRPSSALGQWWSHWPPRASRQWHRARRCCHHCHQCHRTTPTLPPGALPPRPRARYPFLVDYSSSNTRGRHDRASSAPALTVFLRRASRPLSDQNRICNRLTCTRLRHCLRASTKTNPRTACYYIAVRLIFRFPREITMTRLLQEKDDGTAWIVDNDDELVISRFQGVANSVIGYDTGWFYESK